MEETNKIIFYIDKFLRDPFMERVVSDDDGPFKEYIITSTSNVVGEGNVIAKILQPGDPEYSTNKPGIEDFSDNPSSYESEYVFYNSKTKEFISKLYGFARLKDKKFEITPLIKYSDDNLFAYIYVYPTVTKQLPTLSEIRKFYDIEKIVHPLEDFKIKNQLEELKGDPNKIGERITIAEGAPPVNGVVELIELRKIFEKKVGKELDDGRIDYKEKDYFYTINKGETVVERIPEVAPIDGVDVFGNTIKGVMTGESQYKIGNNLESEFEGSDIFIASLDGVLEITEDGKISVEERLVVNSDVNLTTGNVRFPGIIEIKGNVQRGFEVEAEKSIFVNGNIEDAIVKAGGDITIQNGILGKEICTVTAKGSITARFVQNAVLKADENIQINESIVHGKCIAKNKIIVQGHVVGGELIARNGMTAVTAGSPAESKTRLIVGKDPEVENRIEELNVTINELLKILKENLDEMTLYFGDNIMSDIKKILPTLPDHRKKQCLKLLKAVKEINSQVVEMKVERDKLKATLTFEQPPTIEILENVYPGVSIQIKDSKKKIDSHFNSKVLFKEDVRLKVIYWD